ncbi:helix-turn-helix domain-containing protein [Streptomyces sp. Je 1-369]|uniref:helix-turn-helix domain-containing protein n=1 Tax=Streptomyces sp. Je 1-369 TaxID=2966192 RepID=UPI0022865859|nr:helix-turn-helix domain-containing protein [Streptomyces sp. Je 1-369]WAL99580.1 helix-turn-helix domain-containing protein [Streptomyces sp. Je 1-369]
MSIIHKTRQADDGAEGPVVSANTDVVPAAERFGWWSDMVGDEVMPVTIRSPHAARFRGSVEAVGMPHSQVAAFAFSPMTARRSPLQIRRHDLEEYYLVLVQGSPVRLEQAGSVACLEAGDMALFSTSAPLVSDFLDQGRQTRLTLLRLARSALPLAGGRADRLLAESLSTRPGSGSAALLGSYLSGLPAAAHACDPAELARLGAIGVDLAATVLAGRLGAQDTLSPETRKAVLRARIKLFIEHNLGDPELVPAGIAAQHHISVRSLHLLFRHEPETVGAMIRRLRLERCHADLTDPALGHRTLAATAARWGFRHPADFGRAFRKAYGVPPSEVRAGVRARARALDAQEACARCRRSPGRHGPQ